MSIIHEALKKAQADLEKKENHDLTKMYEELHHPLPQKNKPLEPNRISSAENSVSQGSLAATVLSPDTASPLKDKTEHLGLKPSLPSRKSWIKIIFILVFIFFVGSGMLLGIFPHILNQPYKSAPTIAEPKFSKSKEVPQPTEKNPLILSGTMMMGDKRVALINNEIYEVGESVEGKKIINITLEKVELLDGPNTLILKVSK